MKQFVSSKIISRIGTFIKCNHQSQLSLKNLSSMSPNLPADAFDKNVLAPYTYILPAKSNLLCAAKFPVCFNHWLKIPKETVDAIEESVHFIVNAIVLFDDIQDNSQYRRSLPAAHCVYGIPLTLNASIHALLLGLDKTIKLGHPQGPEVFAKLMIDFMRGQGIEIYWRDNFICPTEEEYKLAAVKKNASALMLSLGMMQLFSKDKRDYSNLITNLAILYQIRDEYCNITNPEALEEKSSETKVKGMKDTHICEDIAEGKITWPVLHALKTSEASEIRDILKQHTNDVKLKKKCLSLLDQAGSLQYTRNTLRSLDRDCRAEIRRLGGNPGLEALLDDLLNWDTDNV